jgi:cupin-like protein
MPMSVTMRAAFHGLPIENKIGDVPIVPWNSSGWSWNKELRRPAPLVVEGWADDRWAAPHKWSLDYIKDAVGDAKVAAVVLGDGGDTTLDYFAGTYRKLSVAELVDAIAAQVRNPVRAGDLYLAQGGNMLRPELRALMNDIEMPDFSAKCFSVALWLGSGGSRTYLHYDPAYNLLTVLEGEKRFVLISPDQTRYVYPKYYPDPLGSAVNVVAPDFVAHPALRHARYWEVCLERGQSLILPPGWWHYVVSEGFNMSVGMWWTPEPWHYLKTPLRGTTLARLRKNPSTILKRLREEVFS